ncbi:MAG: 2-thiouracil desulfurase family protein [Candidatus Enteromonas sp.]|nr:2-thiouracil desulfurase family protein [Candidatus Enteromonas sp.]
MEKILISACLIGDPTRYDGGSNRIPELEELMHFFDLVPFCPEMEGGLKCPRKPAEIRGNGVFTLEGTDVTSYYNEGASKAYALCRYLGIRTAILKENSPACGTHTIHNGLFNGGTVSGMGICAQFLKAHGIRVISEEEIDSFLQFYRNRETHREELVAQVKEQEAQERAAKEELASRSEKEERSPRKEHEDRAPRKEGYDRGSRKPRDDRGPRKPREERHYSSTHHHSEDGKPHREGGYSGKGRGEKRFDRPRSSDRGYGKKGSFSKKPYSKGRPSRSYHKDEADKPSEE